MYVTASILYAYTKCPHGVWLDANGDQAEKDLPNEFVQLLWERGTQYEKEVIDSHREGMELVDLSGISKSKRFAPTLDAMKKNAPFIYQGRLETDGLVGEPDLLQLLENGEYMPVDIKSGMGVEGVESDDDEEGGKLKKHYALQLCLYVDALQKLGFATHHKGMIWDSRGKMVSYDLLTPQGVKNKQTWWDLYQELLPSVRELLENRIQTESALISACKLCQWYTHCKKECVGKNDISLVPELGRSRKESINAIALDVVQLSKIDVDKTCDKKGKTGMPGIGRPTLEKFVRRANLLTSGTKEPLIRAPFILPEKSVELFFDLEADPTRDLVYLHGIVERRDGKTRFCPAIAKEPTPEAEKEAWIEFWNYIHTLPKDDIVVYYYSKYERTQYRALREKYPDVVSEEELEAFFDPAFAIDLYYDIVLKCTDWPTYNYSVKTIAQLLGFNWRDKHPSGAASIEWYNTWCKTKDPKDLQRILDYNEDDCIAMQVLKDKLASVTTFRNELTIIT